MSEQLPTLPLLRDGARALGIPLDERQLRRFSRFAAVLVAWSRRINLTAVTDPDDVQVKHFLDSLVLAPIVDQELGGQGGALVDVGSGAGFPGIPLAIALPNVRVALLEATARKVDFLRRVLAEIELENAYVLHGRAENLARDPELRERFDVATARAVGTTAALVELLLPFLRVGGVAVLQKTRAGLARELPLAEAALTRLYGEAEEVRNVAIPGVEDRAVLLVRKRGATPEIYPRRAGAPKRRPIAG